MEFTLEITLKKNHATSCLSCSLVNSICANIGHVAQYELSGTSFAPAEICLNRYRLNKTSPVYVISTPTV